MVSRRDILDSVGAFFDTNLSSRPYQRISRLKDELEGRLETIHQKLQEWFKQEKDTDEWVIFKHTHEKSLFTQPFSLKKAVLYIKAALRQIGYEMTYSTYPQSKVITFTDMNVSTPVELVKLDPPRPFAIHHGRFIIRFNNSPKGDEFHYDERTKH